MKAIVVSVMGPEWSGVKTSVSRHLEMMRPHLELHHLELFKTNNSSVTWAGRLEREGEYSKLSFGAHPSADLELQGKVLFNKLCELFEGLKIEGHELVHFWGPSKNLSFIVSMAAKYVKLPLWLNFRGTDITTKPFGKWFAHIKASVEFAENLITVSESNQRLLETFFELKPITVIRNSIELSDSEALACEGKTIGMVGPFRAISGLDMCLEVADLMADTHPQVKIKLIGGLEEDAKKYYEPQFQLRQNIIFLGQLGRNEAMDEMKNCSLMFFPSVEDACPNKVLEAMSLKLPIVASTSGGIGEILENGKTALLCEAFDAQKFSSNINSLLTNAQLCRDLATAAYEQVRTKFSPQREIEEYRSLYLSHRRAQL